MSDTEIRVNKALTNYSVAYRNGELIADLALPRVSETSPQPFYYKWDKDAFRLDNDQRAPGTKSNRASFGVKKQTEFNLTEHTLHDLIPIETINAAKDADQTWDIKQDYVQMLIDKMLNRYEYDTAATLFNTSTFSGYTSALSGNNRWDVYGTSDPLADAETAKELVRAAVGIYPNTAIMGATVFSKLRNHPDVLARIVGGSTSATPAQVTRENLAILLGVDKVLVGSAIYNSAPEGATDSMADIWGKFCLFAYINPRPSKLSASLGYTFYDPNFEGVREKYKDEERAQWVEVSKKYIGKLTSVASAYLYSTVIS